MQIFRCPSCDRRVYFHNLSCDCGQQLTFDPTEQVMRKDRPFCANRDEIGCNWTGEFDGLCRSCNMTEVLPDLREADNLPLWARTEGAKRWVLANVARWGWFQPSDPGDRPKFRLLSEQTFTGEEAVTMGHADGVITINVTEASDPVLAQRQDELGELYRTMIGHFRHELSHFLQLRLSADEQFLAGFRELFGDEREDYGAALQRHYQNPKPGDETHITSYATAHPHEDWAETIAHLLHLVDMLDSAASARLALPEGPREGYDAYADADTEGLVSQAVAMSMAVNHVNRALDLPDLYPFVLTNGVRHKMAFAHAHLREGAGRG